MKRFCRRSAALLLGLGLGLALSLAACGAAETAQSAPSDAVSAQVSEEDSAVSPDAPADGAEAAGTAQPVELDLSETGENITYAADGKQLLTCTYQRPRISGASSSAELSLIQADLEAQLGAILSEQQELGEYAQSEVNDIAEFQQEREFVPYTMDVIFAAARNDGRVFSVIASYSTYTGGVHGALYQFCLNYDAATGERITLESLGEDFYQAACDAVLAQAGEMTADKVTADQPAVVDDYANYVEDVVSENTFYFSDEGVVFVSGQYVMQSYAAGIIEFTVPYDQLTGLLPENLLP